MFEITALTPPPTYTKPIEYEPCRTYVLREMTETKRFHWPLMWALAFTLHLPTSSVETEYSHNKTTCLNI